MAYRSYKLKLYPTEEQKKAIEINLDNNRAVYNWGFVTKRFLYDNYGMTCSNFDLRKMLTKDMHPKGCMSFLKGEYCDTSSYAYTLMNLAANFRLFYKGVAGYPKLKKKKQREQKYVTSNTRVIITDDNKIKIAKIGLIKVSSNAEQLKGKFFKRVCISRDRTNTYYVSVTYEDESITDVPKKENPVNKIGIDVGIRTMCTLSNGERINAPDFIYRSEKKLRRLNRKLGRESRLNNGQQSHTYEKTRVKFAKCYKKVSNQRLDFVHKLSTSLVRQYDEIHIEDYHTDQWITKHCHPINKRINDSCLGKLREQLEYKCEWYGVNLVIVDKYYPSTQICSSCGYRNRAAKAFDVHEWDCPNCGVHHDRDLNAAINILQWHPGTSYGYC